MSTQDGAMFGTLHPQSVPVKLAQTLDPRIRLGNERSYAIFKGAKEVTPQQFPATSSSDTNIVFDVNPPSSFIIVDKKVWITCPFLVNFTGADLGSPLLDPGVLDAPRAFPLSQTILSTRATINNTTVSINTNNVMQALWWYHQKVQTRRSDFSGSCAMLDQAQNYADLVGAVRNPLAGYGDNTAEEARGAGQAGSLAQLIAGQGTYYVISNTNTAAQVMVIVQEPIFLSPYLFGPGDEAGFYGVNKMSVNLQMGDLTRCWSHDNVTRPLLTITASIQGALAAGAKQPQIQFQYLTPNVIPQLPSQIYYPYFEVIEYVTSGGAVAPATASQITSNNIFFPTIPRRLYVFVRQRNADRTAFTTDTFASIQSINVTFANRTGLLQSQNPQSLYDMAQQNGYDGSWIQWSNFVGSVLALDLGKNIGLDSSNGEAPGVSGAGQYQFTVTVNFTNINQSNSIMFDLYVVAIQEGTMLIEQNHAMLATGVVTPLDVKQSISAPMIPYAATEKIYGGGSFWSDLRNIAGKVVKGVEKALPYVERYAPVAARLLGVGKGKAPIRRGRMHYGKSKRRGGMGPTLVGGQLDEQEAEYSDVEQEDDRFI